MVKQFSSESNNTIIIPGTLLLIHYCNDNESLKNITDKLMDYQLNYKAEIKFVNCHEKEDFVTVSKFYNTQ